MKVLLTTAKYLDRWLPGSVPRTCGACRRAIKPGEHVIARRLNTVAYADGHIHDHVDCIRALIADVPSDTPAGDPLAAAAQLAAAQA